MKGDEAEYLARLLVLDTLKIVRKRRMKSMQIGDYLRDGRGLNLHWWRLYQALGLNPKRHLPAEGLSERMVGNVPVWILSKQDAAAVGLFHRILCRCPDCGWEGSAGRLHQHLGGGRPRKYHAYPAPCPGAGAKRLTSQIVSISPTGAF